MNALSSSEPCVGWQHPICLINIAIHPKMHFIPKDDFPTKIGMLFQMLRNLVSKATSRGKCTTHKWTKKINSIKGNHRNHNLKFQFYSDNNFIPLYSTVLILLSFWEGKINIFSEHKETAQFSGVTSIPQRIFSTVPDNQPSVFNIALWASNNCQVLLKLVGESWEDFPC